MRAATQRLYWSLAKQAGSGHSLDFRTLSDLAGIAGRSNHATEVLTCLTELKAAGLVSYVLDLDGASEIVVDASPTAQRTMRSVFVVHGHDDALLAEVDALLLRLGLLPIVLKMAPSGGRTLIEMVEDHSAVPFAVCLLTPDDEGRALRSDETLRPRARQNVILELGYFMGRLGRDRVHVLHRGGVELPSDYHGVIYTATDVPNSDWRFELCKEMRAAGLPIDIEAIMR